VVLELSAHPPGDARWALLQEAWLYLAFGLSKLGKAEETTRALERLLRVDPDFQLDSEAFPPSFRRLVVTEKDRLSRVGRGSLHVRSATAGLPLYVDGKPVGLSPLTLSLPEGRYRVEAQDGLSREVTLSAAAQVELHLDAGKAVPPEPVQGPDLVEGVSTARVSGYALSAAAAAALAGSCIFGVRAYRSAAEMQTLLAEDRTTFPAESVARYQTLQQRHDLGTRLSVGLGVGALALGAGAGLLFLLPHQREAPRSGPQLSLLPTPDGVWTGLSLTF
jgi:hypothetical protein